MWTLTLVSTTSPVASFPSRTQKILHSPICFPLHVSSLYTCNTINLRSNLQLAENYIFETILLSVRCTHKRPQSNTTIIKGLFTILDLHHVSGICLWCATSLLLMTEVEIQGRSICSPSIVYTKINTCNKNIKSLNMERLTVLDTSTNFKFINNYYHQLNQV
mgnify:CR=1 FL=1